MGGEDLLGQNDLTYLVWLVFDQPLKLLMNCFRIIVVEVSEDLQI